MKNSEQNVIDRDCERLLQGLERDKKRYFELEKAGLLDEGYDPQMRSIHEENADLLIEFIKKYGWPYPTTFGSAIYEAAWMIAIHSISRPVFMKQVFKILEQALAVGEPVASEYVRFYDRIALFEGRQQVYGTQLYPSPQGWVARDLCDPDHVDERRKSLGLSTFLEHKAYVGADQGGFIDESKQKAYDDYWTEFLKDVGWQ